eukprot:2376981-Ditylum_brightwellii.AAC.1
METLMQIAPVPTFMVYDGLTKDLDTIMVLDHLQESEDYSLPYMKHCCNVLHAAMVKYQHCSESRSFHGHAPHWRPRHGQPTR